MTGTQVSGARLGPLCQHGEGQGTNSPGSHESPLMDVSGLRTKSTFFGGSQASVQKGPM